MPQRLQPFGYLKVSWDFWNSNAVVHIVFLLQQRDDNQTDQAQPANRCYQTLLQG